MGLFSRNQNRHGLIGKRNNMFEKCCTEIPEECCEPLPPCSCGFTQYLVFTDGEGSVQYQPFSSGMNFGEINAELPFSFDIAIENTGTCYLEPSSVNISITGGSSNPIQVVQTGEFVLPGERQILFNVTIPAGADPSEYLVSITFEICGGTNGEISFSLEIPEPVQFELRLAYHELIEDGLGGYTIGNELVNSGQLTYEIISNGILPVFPNSTVYTEGALQGLVLYITPISNNQQISTLSFVGAGLTQVIGDVLPFVYTVGSEQLLAAFIADTSVSGVTTVAGTITIENSFGYGISLGVTNDVWSEKAYNVRADLYELFNNGIDYSVSQFISTVHNINQDGSGIDGVLGVPIPINAGIDYGVHVFYTPLNPHGVVEMQAISASLNLTSITSPDLSTHNGVYPVQLPFGFIFYDSLYLLDQSSVPGVHVANITTNIDLGPIGGPFETTLDLSYDAI